MKKAAGYEVRLNDNGMIDGVYAFGKLCGVYKKDKNQSSYTKVLPLSVSAFKSGIYAGRYFVI